MPSHIIGIVFMAQSLRINGTERPAAYWEVIRDRIDCGAATTNLNKMANGIELPSQVERVSLFIINKMLPNLQAVAVEITHKSSANLLDLKARADLLGIDPSLLMGHTSLLADTSADIDESIIDSVAEEKQSVPADSIEAPIPPD
jgi:hypothetical protein